MGAAVDARYTRDFDDLTAWLAQQMNQTQIHAADADRAGRTVGNIIDASSRRHARSRAAVGGLC